MLYDCSRACNMCKRIIQIIEANNMEFRHNLNCHKNVKVSHIHLQTFSLVLIQSRKKHISVTHISEFVLHEENIALYFRLL